MTDPGGKTAQETAQRLLADDRAYRLRRLAELTEEIQEASAVLRKVWTQ